MWKLFLGLKRAERLVFLLLVLTTPRSTRGFADMLLLAISSATRRHGRRVGFAASQWKRKTTREPCNKRRLALMTASSHTNDSNANDQDADDLLTNTPSSANSSRRHQAENHEKELELLEQEILRLNNGRRINVNSPKQVATAVFGRMQSTNREMLQQAAEGKFDFLSERQRQLAALVLNVRRLERGSRTLKKEVQRNAFSTLSGDEDEQPDTFATSDRRGVVLNNDNSVPELTTRPASSQHGPESLSSHERQVEELFDNGSRSRSNKKRKIHHYWKEPLSRVTRPTSQALVSQLDPFLCPMGFDPLATAYDPLRGNSQESGMTTSTTTTAGKKGSFLAFCREQKERYPDAIILTRCGDFYETFGVDAIMLVEHCGLNSMAGKAKAGCPIRNVQATLDCLTAQGFRVAVYEEATDTDASTGAAASGGSKSRIKNRFLAQIVSSASPTYLYDLVLLGNTDTLVTAPPSRPYVGVLSLSSGFMMVEVSIEERSVRVSERLTAEAVACRLAAYPPADLFYVPPVSEYESSARHGAFSLPFLPSRKESSINGPGSRLRTRIIPPSLIQEPRAGVTDVDRAKHTIVSALLQMTESREEDSCLSSSSSQRRATVDDFTVVSSSHEQSSSNATHTNPLYVETATQLGLMDDKAIPSLVSYILPQSAPAASRRFLRRFLLTPPPPVVGEAMAKLVSYLKDAGPALPPLAVPPVGKVLALLRTGQASAQVYGELLRAMNSTVLLLDMFEKEPSIVESLMILLEHESGLAADVDSVKFRCAEAIQAIEDIISPLHHAGQSTHDRSEPDRISDYDELIPRAFFERNEATWRGRVRPESASVAYSRVQETAQCLAEAVISDFLGLSITDYMRGRGSNDGGKNPIVQDIFNNIFALREVPANVDKRYREKYIHPRDRFGKVIRNRYTTEVVQEALSDYVDACEQARQDVTSVLVRLSQMLYDKGHIPALVQASHTNLIVSSAFYHAARANSLGWCLAETYEAQPGNDSAGYFNNLWPYWMDRTEAVGNSFDFSGMWLLTAPNMAGKSTILRSAAAASLLSICGLAAPLADGSSVRRFDHLFVRGASSDVPTEQKSAFGAEMGDVAALLRSCGDKSLVFVDELGRGTSPRDGTRLAGAVLEAMAVANMSGIFATHLHDILHLPLKASDRIVKKRMAIHERDCAGNELSRYSWTYRLEDGVCTDSMALATASRFGLPREVLERAEALAAFLPDSSIRSPVSAEGLNGVRQTTNKSDASPINPSLDEIKRLIEEVCGQGVASIPAQWSAPATMDGESCVYVLELNETPPMYYVGETDNLRQRIEQHRSKGGSWVNVEAVAVPVRGGKSEARALESLLIRKLARAGIPLQSSADGRTIRAVRSL